MVQGQVQVLKHMSQHGEKLQDWPHIGQFTDQHTYGNNTALAKEGRSSGQTLLAWGRHLRLADSDGTVWMLVPASRLKTDWQRSKASKKEKNRQYKPRDPIVLPDKAVAAFKDLVQATSVDAVELALQDLKSYDVKEKHFTNWRAAAKTFDDWRLVCFGPQASAYWQVHSAGLPPPAGRNLHMGCLCWFCHVSSRWGPCEHMYCCAEHEGKINAGVLPEAKRSGRPPKRFAKAAPSEHAPPTVVTPGPMMQRESSAGSCGPSIPAQAPLPTEDTLHKLLRKVVLGQYVQEFQRQGATLAAVTALSVDGLRTFFGFDLGQAHALKTAIDALPTASASSAPSSAVSPHAPVCASAWLC